MMENTWKIQIWGVRGSAPAPSKEFLFYGGNTVCVSVANGTELVVFDAGSGLSNLGDTLNKEGRYKRLDIFLSHLHLDHLMGLFSFRPLYCPDMEIHIYGQSPNQTENTAFDGSGLKEALTRLLGPPYWPLGIEDFKARVFIHPLLPGKSLRLYGQENLPENTGIILHTLQGNHPGKSLLYRMEENGKSLVYGLDCEMDKTIASAYLDFAQHADLLLWDATFAKQDLKKGWGHSTWEQGIAARRDAKAKQVLMIHYASGYTDEFLSQQEKLAKEMDLSSSFAREGMSIILQKPKENSK